MVCDFLVPVVNLPDRLPCPSILFTHNVEAEIWRRHAEQASNPVSKRLLTQQWNRMLRFERVSGRLMFDNTFHDPGSDRPGVSFEREDWPHGRTGRGVPHGSVFIR